MWDLIKTRKVIVSIVAGDFNSSLGNTDNRTVDHLMGPFGKRITIAATSIMCCLLTQR